MSTQPTLAALSAAFSVRHGPEHVAFYMHRHEIEGAGSEDLAAAESIDRLAVKPATAELLAALNKLCACVAPEIEWRTTKALRSGQRLTESRQAESDALAEARAVIAKHKART